MIISEIQAGLGNQLFMYAAGRSLSERLGEEFKIDLTWFNSWPKSHCKRPYALDKFNISAEVASKKEVRKFVNKTFSRYGYRIVEELNLFKKKCYIEKYHNMEDFFKIKKGDVYLKGYFINPQYFDNIKEIIKKEFSLKAEYKKNIKDKLKEIKKSNSVAVHIRRGDFVNTKSDTSIKYYKDSISELRKKIKNSEFYIFSDDIEWCKKNLREIGDLKYIENLKEYEDFELMKNCKHQIISKSTFSWWAAYLNSNKNKIIISPNDFYNKPQGSVPSKTLNNYRDKIKIYLQSPWRKGGECSYYKFLREDLPQNIEFVNKESSTIIQNKRNLKLNNFIKQKVKEIIKKIYPSMPNAHKTPSGNYDLIHCAHCLSKNKDKPWVTDIEYIEQLWAMGWNDGKLNSKKEVLKILKSKNCKKILPWTNWVKEKIIKEFPEIKEKVEVLYPGIPLPKKKNKKITDKIVILYASRNFYFKGGLYAIETMDKVTKDNPKVEGWIVSEVPKEIYEKYKSNKQIKFIGMVPQKKLFEEIYPSSDIFLYPSFTDTFGFAITEAMSFGLPVVSAEGQSRKELVENGKSGFIIKTGLTDVVESGVLRKINTYILNGFIQNTRELIENNSLRLDMGNNSRKEVESGKFSVNERNKKLERIYLESIKNE